MMRRDTEFSRGGEYSSQDPLDSCRDFLCYPRYDTPEWFREPGSEFNYRPYGHTPFNPYHPRVIEHQVFLKSELGKLAHYPPAGFEDESLRDLFEIDLQAGIAHREGESQANYFSWHESHPDEVASIESDNILSWIHGEAITGRAHPAGLLHLLSAAPSMPSLDLQVLTTPYGYRRNHIPAMRKELRQAIEEHKGVYFADAPIIPEKIKIAPHFYFEEDGSRRLDAILATYKRTVGIFYASRESKTDLVKVMERHAVVLRTDKTSGFPQAIVDVLESATQQNGNVEKAKKSIKELIQYPAAYDFLTPNSIMTYAYRRVRSAEKTESEPEISLNLQRLIGESGLTLEQLRAALPPSDGSYT